VRVKPRRAAERSAALSTSVLKVARVAPREHA
jgi:hypothetical protein